MVLRSSGVTFTILLGALAAIAPLSVDMGLPAFPALELGLHASAEGAALTLSVFLAGFSTAQLILGPLSDRIGRRPVLLGGLSLYAAAGVLCALAPSIEVLIALRLVQGLCAASGSVMALAVVRDLFSGAAARTRFSYVAVVISLAPIVAPTLGGALLLVAGWRGIFWLLAAAGMVLMAAVLLLLPETRQVSAGRLSVARGFARVLRTRQSIGFAATNALSFGALFAYISGSPQVLMGALGASPALFSLLFAINSAAILLGAWLNGRLAARGVPSRLPVAAALGLALVAASVLVLQFVLGQPSLLALMPGLAAHAFCRGIVAPSATHAALEPMGEIAGLASSVVGFLQMATGAVSGAVLALLFHRLGPAAMPAVMAAFAFAALLAWRFADAPLPAAAAMRGE